jgi:hypothetical protein
VRVLEGEREEKRIWYSTPEGPGKVKHTLVSAVPWFILPIVICFSRSLSYACHNASREWIINLLWFLRWWTDTWILISHAAFIGMKQIVFSHGCLLR